MITRTSAPAAIPPIIPILGDAGDGVRLTDAVVALLPLGEVVVDVSLELGWTLGLGLEEEVTSSRALADVAGVENAGLEKVGLLGGNLKLDEIV